MDVPLLHAISEGAINTLRNFKVQEISSLLWSLSSMSVLVDGEPSCRIVQQLSAAPIIVHEAHSGQSWQGHYLCLLANALHPVRDRLDRSVWLKVHSRWAECLAPLAEFLRVITFPVDADKYVEALVEFGLFHVGPYYTRELLRSVGVGSSPPGFVEDALERVFAYEVSQKTSHAAGIVGVVSYDITIVRAFRSAHRIAGCRLVASSQPVSTTNAGSTTLGACEGAEVAEDFSMRSTSSVSLRPVLNVQFVSVPLAHDRSGHAEIQILSELFSQLDSSVVKQSAVGIVHLYVTHHPCLSCLGAVCQFRAAFPGVVVSVSYDWRPSVPRGGGRHILASE